MLDCGGCEAVDPLDGAEALGVAVVAGGAVVELFGWERLIVAAHEVGAAAEVGVVEEDAGAEGLDDGAVVAEVADCCCCA